MLIWRLTTTHLAEFAFSGEGAAKYGRRWNPKSTFAVYTASSLSLAALEYFVNLSLPRQTPPLVAISAEIPDSLRIDVIDHRMLPPDWRSMPHSASTQEIGARWIRDESSPLLSVPSTVIPQERNYVLNPAHRDFRKIRIGKPQPFSFDPRMWK